MRKPILEVYIMLFIFIITFSGCSPNESKNALDSLITGISDEEFETEDLSLVGREGKGSLLDMDGQRVLVLRGSPYEIGYQHGVLLRDDVTALAKMVLNYIAEIDPDGLGQAWEAAEPNIPERFKEEMWGLADGSGVAIEDIQKINMFPELFHCTGIALFGDATTDGTMLHARVLDYTIDQHLQDYAVVMLVQQDGGNTFLNAGLAGIIGSVTGINDQQIGIGEMGGDGEGYWEGVPMTFLIRMALEQCATLDECVALFNGAPRTCEYYYVLSDAKIPDAIALYCTPEEFVMAKPGEDSEYLPAAPPKDVLIVSAGDRYLTALERINENYGHIDQGTLIEILKRPVAMESNLYDAIFVPDEYKMLLAVAADPTETDFQACYQTYYEYDMVKLIRFCQIVAD